MQMSKMKGQIQCRTPCFKWIYVYYYCFYIVVCSPGFTSAGVTILHFSSRCIFQNGRQLLLVIPNYSDLPKVKFVLCMCFVCLLHILLLYWPFYYSRKFWSEKKIELSLLTNSEPTQPYRLCFFLRQISMFQNFLWPLCLWGELHDHFYWN